MVRAFLVFMCMYLLCVASAQGRKLVFVPQESIACMVYHTIDLASDKQLETTLHLATILSNQVVMILSGHASSGHASGTHAQHAEHLKSNTAH